MQRSTELAATKLSPAFMSIKDSEHELDVSLLKALKKSNKGPRLEEDEGVIIRRTTHKPEAPNWFVDIWFVICCSELRSNKVPGKTCSFWACLPFDDDCWVSWDELRALVIKLRVDSSLSCVWEEGMATLVLFTFLSCDAGIASIILEGDGMLKSSKAPAIDFLLLPDFSTCWGLWKRGGDWGIPWSSWVSGIIDEWSAAAVINSCNKRSFSKRKALNS